MKAIIFACLFGYSLAALPVLPVPRYYHESFGIQEAAFIKAAEEATDFDGSRIVGGSAADLGQYPWVGGLLITLLDGRTSVCGSSLLSATKGVTAAHCWFDGRSQAASFEIVLGSLRLFSGGSRVRSTDVVTHEDWDWNNIQNDVAVITYDEPAPLSDIIRPVSLPLGINDDFVGRTAYAAGFGRQRDGAGISTSQQLHHTALEVISNSACSRYFGSTITPGVVCIDGSTGKSTCNGDSGGPLTVVQNGESYLIGITSFGSAWGCSIGFPAAFTRVTYFIDWINARL